KSLRATASKSETPSMETGMKLTRSLMALAAVSITFALTACAESSHPSGHGTEHDPNQHGSAPHEEMLDAAEPGMNAHEGHDMQVTEENTPVATPSSTKADEVVAPAPVSAQDDDAAGSAAAAPASTQGAADQHTSKKQMTVKTSIADRATVTGSVTRIDLEFGHEMKLVGATLSSLAGDRIDVRIESEKFTDRASVNFEMLEPDDYTFTWRADAGDHEMSGSLRFTVEQ
ncbi:MAG TPA: copper resistance protein CopC, partial [Hyphomonas sp.]|nr:copper resistance protein CopC [Hyphomonas sp.]